MQERPGGEHQKFQPVWLGWEMLKRISVTSFLRSQRNICKIYRSCELLVDLKRINICLVIRTILNAFGRTDVTSLGHQLALRKLLGEGLSLSANGCICIMILQILDNFYEFLISEYFNEFLLFFLICTIFKVAPLHRQLGSWSESIWDCCACLSLPFI